MSDLTEIEVIDRMKTSLREAVQSCKELSIRSRTGPHYSNLRENLGLIEGALRQLAAFRGDTRWLPIALQIEQCHKSAGGWLRGYWDHGVKIVLAPGQNNKMFMLLGNNLIAIYDAVDKLSTAKTGIAGPILPAVMAETRRLGRPSLSPKSRLIVPPKYAKAG